MSAVPLEDLRLELMSDGTQYRVQANTSPPGPKSGHVVEGCLAAPLEDCGGKLSADHYISKALLKWLNEAGYSFGMPGASLIARGIPGLAPDEQRSMPPSALTVKAFCQRHNNALSPVDDEALRFFMSLAEMTTQLQTPQTSPVHDFRTFNGHDLERWFLKALCGMTAFGASRLFTDLPVTVDLEREWIEMLFGLSLFTDRRGLYCPGTLGKITYGRLGFSLDPLRKGVSLVGLSTEFQGLAFNLSALGDIQLFRPPALHFSNGVAEKGLLFWWDLPGDNQSIHIRVHPPEIRRSVDG